MACAFYALPALAGSQARIVRLRDVQGSVQIDKDRQRSRPTIRCADWFSPAAAIW
jgi:hypothetical protein